MSVCITTSGFQMLYVPPPGPPLNLTSSPSSSTQINLSWSAAAPQPGTSIATYTVYRNSQGNFPPLGMVGGTTLAFSDTGLSALTPYTYYVVATDSKGAVSAASNQTSATTLGPPLTVPTGLQVTAVTTTTVSLSWAASTGATHYNLYRAGVLVGSPSALTFTDSGLTPATMYAYTVQAVDSSGNTSAQSSAVQGTTAATGHVKTWVPAQGGLLFYGVAGGSQSQINLRLAQYNSDIAFGLPNPFVYQYMGHWVDIETDFNVYSIASIIQDMQLLASNGIYFAFKVGTYGGGDIPEHTIPTYLYDTGNLNYSSTYGKGYYGANVQSSSTASNRNMWRVQYWQPGIQTRLIALHNYLANVAQITVGGVTYTGLNNFPWLLAVNIDEETQASNINQCLTNGGWGTDSYSASGWNEAWRLSVIPQLGAIWTKKNVLVPFNQVATTSGAYVTSFMQAIADAKCAFCTPDSLPNNMTGTLLDGVSYPGGQSVLAYLGKYPGGKNFSGSVPFLPLVEQPDMPGGVFYQGPAVSGSPAAQGVTWINNANTLGTPTAPANANLAGLHAAINFWQIQPGGPTGSHWHNDVLPTIKTLPIPATPNGVYPTGYP